MNLLDQVPSFSGNSASATLLGIDAWRGERVFGHRHFATLWLVLGTNFTFAWVGGAGGEAIVGGVSIDGVVSIVRLVVALARYCPGS